MSKWGTTLKHDISYMIIQGNAAKKPSDLLKLHFRNYMHAVRTHAWNASFSWRFHQTSYRQQHSLFSSHEWMPMSSSKLHHGPMNKDRGTESCWFSLYVDTGITESYKSRFTNYRFKSFLSCLQVVNGMGSLSVEGTENLAYTPK